MPDRPKLPPPDDLENGIWSRDQIMNFTREEFAEWDHQTNGLGQFISFFPNRKLYSYLIFIKTGSRIPRNDCYGTYGMVL